MTLNEAVKALWGKAFSISQGYKSSHDGLDIAAKEGTPVYAVASGVVRYARDARTQTDKGASGWAMGGGNVVNVLIGSGLQTQYAHLQAFVVREGQSVSKGDLIGYVGRTGGKTASGAYGGPGSQFVGAHVHFGLWDTVKNKMVDPTSLLTNAASGVDAGDLSIFGVKIKAGHVVNDTDIENIIKGMEKAGLFNADPISNALAIEEVRKALRRVAKDKPFSSEVLVALQAELGIVADHPFTGGDTPLDPGNIPNVDLLGGATSIATYALALVLVVVGVVIYSRSIGGTGEPAAA